jgi:hypothetical protein
MGGAHGGANSFGKVSKTGARQTGNLDPGPAVYSATSYFDGVVGVFDNLYLMNTRLGGRAPGAENEASAGLYACKEK